MVAESGGYGEGASLGLAIGISGCRLTEGRLVTQDAETDAGDLVGQGADGLVVVGSTPDLGGPVSNAGEFLSLAGR